MILNDQHDRTIVENGNINLITTVYRYVKRNILG